MVLKCRNKETGDIFAIKKFKESEGTVLLAAATHAASVVAWA